MQEDTEDDRRYRAERRETVYQALRFDADSAFVEDLDEEDLTFIKWLR